ncbi:MAG: hypothetical protein M9955_17225 [Rhizobiaceae bacterium]|nr:hypothetical protein [Rhizobiaceae bacterium]MCO5083385.1 hypothetical protein [Rhizobiaceae bacterium]
MSYASFMEEDARLVILRELAKQFDGRLNETVLTTVLEAFGYRRSREWVRTQLRKLEELGAVSIRAIDRPEADPILVATITRAGADHVERRSVIVGVARPSLGG